MPTWPSTIQFGAKGFEVALLQSVLNEIASAGLLVDGDFGNGTKTAVIASQQDMNLTADGIVGPMTWSKLFQNAERYLIRFKTNNAVADDAATTENDSLYECVVTTERLSASGLQSVSSYRGSVMPDDMNVKGRVVNGWYRVHLGFHKRTGNPTAEDLIVKTSGELRPCIVVNEDKDVPVTSNDPTKTASNAIHIHNGFNTERGSDGCQTIRPSEWADFIKEYLTKYVSLSDWHLNNSYRGRDIGVLIIE